MIFIKIRIAKLIISYLLVVPADLLEAPADPLSTRERPSESPTGTILNILPKEYAVCFAGLYRLFSPAYQFVSAVQ